MPAQSFTPRAGGDILVTFYGELLFLDFCNFVFFRILNLTLILTGKPNPYSNLNPKPNPYFYPNPNLNLLNSHYPNPNPNPKSLKIVTVPIDTAEIALMKLQHLVYTRKISQLVN